MLKKADIGVGIYLLAAIVFLIIPIPAGLLDVLLGLNIAVSLTIMFNAIF
jgi:flagellar biosynthesis protein FlhA